MATRFDIEALQHGEFEPLWPIAICQGAQQTTENLVALSTETAESVSEAYARGVADGMASAEAAYNVELEKLRESIEGRMSEVREAAMQDRAEAMAEAIETEFRDVESRLTKSIVQIVGPAISRLVTIRQTEQIIETASKVLEFNEMRRVEINGPKEWIFRLGDALGQRGYEVDMLETDNCKIKMRIGQTELETELPQFVRTIEDLVNE